MGASHEQGPVVIRARGLRKTYREGAAPVPVLKSVDLEIRRGDFVAIMGRSGSGKTTLLNLIGALDSSYDGHLEVDGRDLSALKDATLARFRNRTVGFVYQTFHLLPHLSARENVALPAFFSRGGRRGDDVASRAAECLRRVDLDGQQHRKPLHLSGGERQRVAIARALFQRPSIILCDEPTGSLDERTGHRIMDLFEALNAELGVTVVVVTHDPRVAERARRVVQVQDGRIARAEGEGS